MALQIVSENSSILAEIEEENGVLTKYKNSHKAIEEITRQVNESIEVAFKKKFTETARRQVVTVLTNRSAEYRHNQRHQEAQSSSIDDITLGLEDNIAELNK
jgi:hypothetical protein